MAHDVFISHSAKDKTTADAVCAMLEAEGIRCWIAPRDVTPGLEWGASIIGAIKQSRVMVLVFTASANASQQIRKEVERAVHHDVAILPFRVENIVPDESLEYFIGNVHWLDALSPPLEAHLKDLARTIKALVAVPEKQKPGVAGAVASEAEIAAKTKPPVQAAAAGAAGIGAAAGFHFWGKQAWTWAGGAVSVVLLAVVFLVIHSWHPTPSGAAPSQSSPGAPAPAAQPAPQPGAPPAPQNEPAQPATSPSTPPPHRPSAGRSANAPANPSSSANAQSDEQQASQFMQAKNYRAALPVAQRACNEGNMTGCNIVGLLYRNGWGVAQNYVLALPFFQEACNGGEVSGCGNLGYLYVNGFGVPQNIPKGAALLQRACNGGRPWSCQQLQQLHR